MCIVTLSSRGASPPGVGVLASWAYLGGSIILFSYLGPQADFPGATNLSLWRMSYCSACALLTVTALGRIIYIRHIGVNNERLGSVTSALPE